VALMSDKAFLVLMDATRQFVSVNTLQEIAEAQSGPREKITDELRPLLDGGPLGVLSFESREALTNVLFGTPAPKAKGIYVYCASLLIEASLHPAVEFQGAPSVAPKLVADAFECGAFMTGLVSVWLRRVVDRLPSRTDPTEAVGLRPLLELAIVLCDLWLLNKAVIACRDSYYQERVAWEQWQRSVGVDHSIEHILQLDLYMSTEKQWRALLSGTEPQLQSINGTLPTLLQK